MKLGLVGPSDGNRILLRDALEFLVYDAGVDQTLYLGLDELLQEVVEEWALSLGGSAHFLSRAVEVAVKGSHEEIDALLAQDEAIHRLSSIHRLPPPPARAIEMIEDRIVTVVYDKAVLDEEDIANSSLLVYGKSSEPLLKRFGTRYFFTPGPLCIEQLGIVEAEEGSHITLSMFDTSGAPLWREPLKGSPSHKLTVSS